MARTSFPKIERVCLKRKFHKYFVKGKPLELNNVFMYYWYNFYAEHQDGINNIYMIGHLNSLAKNDDISAWVFTELAYYYDKMFLNSKAIFLALKKSFDLNDNRCKIRITSDGKIIRFKHVLKYPATIHKGAFKININEAFKPIIHVRSIYGVMASYYKDFLISNYGNEISDFDFVKECKMLKKGKILFFDKTKIFKAIKHENPVYPGPLDDGELENVDFLSRRIYYILKSVAKE